MEVKKGYKQTEVGIIPEDWLVIKLIEGIKLLSGHHVLAQNCNTEGKGLPYLTGPSDFPQGLIKQTKFTEKPSTICTKDDILLTVKGSGAGTIVLADSDYCISRQLMAIRTTWNTSYIYATLKHNELLFRIGATGLIPGLSRTDILEKCIPLPPTIQEQTAIATALSDADALIINLGNLIEKKQAIKQGAMQELLKPKEEWEVKTLGDIASIQRGASPRPIDSPVWFDENSEIGWVRISDVSSSIKYLFDTTQKLSGQGIKNSRFVQSGELIMSICATIGRPILTTFDVCIHDGFVAFYYPKIDKEFLYYYLTFIESEWSKTGQTGSQMNLNTDIIQSREIAFPKKLMEQRAIAETLSVMDTGINLLEQKLSKYKMIKQGMMQELLTGKTRLV